MAVRSVQASLNELDQFAANFKQRPFVQHADLFEGIDYETVSNLYIV